MEFQFYLLSRCVDCIRRGIFGMISTTLDDWNRGMKTIKSKVFNETEIQQKISDSIFIFKIGRDFTFKIFRNWQLFLRLSTVRYWLLKTHSPTLSLYWLHTIRANYCRQQLVKQSKLSSKSNQYELPINRMSYACKLMRNIPNLWWPQIQCIDTFSDHFDFNQSTCTNTVNNSCWNVVYFLVDWGAPT